MSSSSTYDSSKQMSGYILVPTSNTYSKRALSSSHHHIKSRTTLCPSVSGVDLPAGFSPSLAPPMLH